MLGRLRIGALLAAHIVFAMQYPCVHRRSLYTSRERRATANRRIAHILDAVMAAPPAGRAPVSGGRARLIDILLIALIVFDLAVAVGAFLFPQLWYRILHDAAYVDPQGLLRRTGAIWAAFTVLQVLALPRWRTASYWLVLVCGIRLSEMFADWTYLAFADHVTPFGTAALIVTLPANLLICWCLFATYRAAAR